MLMSFTKRKRGWRVPTFLTLGAAGLGAGLMYLLDPDTGRRRRRGIVRRTGRLSHDASVGAARASRDLRNRTAGLFATVRRLAS
jgi:hypothetical protein